jgi:hypothetical protein
LHILKSEYQISWYRKQLLPCGGHYDVVLHRGKKKEAAMLRPPLFF